MQNSKKAITNRRYRTYNSNTNLQLKDRSRQPRRVIPITRRIRRTRNRSNQRHIQRSSLHRSTRFTYTVSTNHIIRILQGKSRRLTRRRSTTSINRAQSSSTPMTISRTRINRRLMRQSRRNRTQSRRNNSRRTRRRTATLRIRAKRTMNNRKIRRRKSSNRNANRSSNIGRFSTSQRTFRRQLMIFGNRLTQGRLQQPNLHSNIQNRQRRRSSRRQRSRRSNSRSRYRMTRTRTSTALTNHLLTGALIFNISTNVLSLLYKGDHNTRTVSSFSYLLLICD